MHIGLTYDLRSEYLAAGYSDEETAEFDQIGTIEALEEALTQLGHTTDRIGHARQLVERLARGDRWELVFNICEGLHGIGRESQVPAILDVYDIPYTFSDPAVSSICLHKAWTKTVVRQAGLPTPDWQLIHEPTELDRFSLSFPVIAKPIAEGTGKGIDAASKISDRASLDRICRRLLDQFRQPAIVERFLPGREFTVGLLGTGPDAEVLGTLEIVLRETAEQDVYSYANKERCEDRVDYVHVREANDEAVAQAEQIALSAWRAVGCRDAGRIDLRCDAGGRPQLIEINPLAGLHPDHSDLPMLCTSVGMTFVELIDRIVSSAKSRVGSVHPTTLAR
ncbi:MAG: D-alanine--D-alanine ligase [Pirellulales bacterium]